jgi:phosphoglycolate phosphatase
MTYGLVIFDFDGTLADSAAWFIDALAEMAPRHGFRAPDAAEIEQLRGCSTREVLQRLGVAGWRLPLIATELRRRSASAGEAIALFDGVAEMIAALHHGGILCAIVSSNSEAHIKRVLGPTIAAQIGLFACDASLFGKAARFRRVIRAAGMSADRTLCVGDEMRDMDAARAVGAAAGAATWGYATRAALLGCTPAHMFDTPADITRAVLGAPA